MRRGYGDKPFVVPREWLAVTSEDPDRSVEPATRNASGEFAGDGVEKSPTVQETVELGVELLAHLEFEDLSLADAMDRLETVTTDPAVLREILDTAVLRGVIEREDGLIRPQRGTYLRFQRDVITREGEFECRRCGTGISTGYFIAFEEGEHGPFGSSCIRKVTGREA